MRNKELFDKCIELRKEGLSYGEIRKIVPIAKSTLQNWLVLSGLTITSDHFEIQYRKRVENRHLAIAASRLIRSTRNKLIVEEFVKQAEKWFDEPLFLLGIMAYEAEGAKSGTCRFSNSDSRLIKLFVKFIEKYVCMEKEKHVSFRLYIHESRKDDLGRILDYWSNELSVAKEEIRVSWKINKVVKRRVNLEYVGQITVSVLGEKLLVRKILAVSDIIMRRCGVV